MIKLLAALVPSVALVANVADAQQEDDRTADNLGELSLSNDTMELKYETGGELIGVEDSRFSAAFFLSEDRDIVLDAGLAFPVNVDLGLGRATLKVGPQVYVALLEDENNDVMSVSVGAQLRLMLIRRLRLAVAGHAYYAPDILTFGSADNLTDFSARLEVGISDRVTVFGGMRWFEFDLTEGDDERTLMEEVFVGFGYRF